MYKWSAMATTFPNNRLKGIFSRIISRLLLRVINGTYKR